ncbi:transforming growth factor beta activator LRRC33 isoform X2 [Mixophyes fleayi]|uniref:transforming growth factor beta activator LRRC33 isoform X2 n=1 Tax=Mixophyes fleayi TaxID=3061075 RepID=UPI003F4D8E16
MTPLLHSFLWPPASQVEPKMMCSRLCALSRVADCRHIQLSSVPQDLPSNTQELLLDYNHLESLSNKSLLRYQELMNLSLRSNSLGFIDLEVFQGTMKLESLSLHDNTISTNYTLVSMGLRSASSLRWLDMSRNYLTGDMVTILLRNLTSLEYLYLDYNVIMRLDGSVFEGLTNLKELSLQRNYIYEIEGGTFEGLVNLKTMNLAFNLLSCIENFGLTQLQMLNLSFNNIEWFLSQEIDVDFQLEKLDISHNQLLFFPFLPKRHHLRSLLLSSNNMKFYANLFDKNSSYVNFLIMENNTTNITTVNLWEGFIPSDLSTLNVLDISRNQFDYLPNEFLAAMTSLSYLKLNWNCLETFDLSYGQISSALNTLDLSNNKLSELRINVSSQSLQQITYLNLSHNRLQELPEQIFSTMDKLSTLDLSHNLILLCSHSGDVASDQGCVDLRNITSLRYLHLSDCGLKLDKHIVFQGTPLTHLDISYNQLKDLHFLLDTTRTLKSLSLRNSLSFVGNIDFSVFQSLIVLDLSENNLTTFPASLTDLALQYLDIHKNKLLSIPLYSTNQPLTRNLNTIYLSNNPFDCCKLSWYNILLTLSTISMPDRQQVTCNVSSNYMSVQEVSESDLDICHWKTGGTFLSLLLTLPTLVTLLVALVLVFLTFKQPLLRMFKRRFLTSSSY